MNANKITVPRQVAEAITHYVALADTKTEALQDILSLGYEATQSEIILRHFDGDYDELMEALICGYEVEGSAEVKIREFYEDLENEQWLDEMQAVEHVLNILGIKIAGVNAQ
jgi:DNA integrity scanning protein DisA with diadenylate cyclase activity